MVIFLQFIAYFQFFEQGDTFERILEEEESKSGQVPK